ncbi:hypothetical protein CU669_02655 [Paramagnetospirillum kuznetsovii]|uniref:PepSY domain-containing protein n=1 Tax=Paramagnetospirillum kuznetsovii TaxID=2053833 RepID=A0A364P1U4_9PROT|nr:PepSY domain-containing protein [Paramagnetospirillum kuznetsovii]RAU23085.1 hypothetical protein CU669_02655 [Paramagnetospirillum kuznetsovii]
MKYALLLLMLVVGLPARAHDHDDARRAVQAGEILPLSAILERVNAEYSGDLIEAELERKHGRPVYEIKLLSKDGKLLKLHYDARDGSALPGKGRP